MTRVVKREMNGQLWMPVVSFHALASRQQFLTIRSTDLSRELSRWFFADSAAVEKRQPQTRPV